ncbi:MAG: NAD(P)H-dependent oxidoreductase subunit E [Laribacter sp.]|nr:NAD(P)H-dependent oxidoreductase subunit E [Laribacter sp.]MBP9527404.1 NAD(P)H-dependent oxidoreductase subunit E [Laribacter sp.]MBP9608814.1 NAD(P)H-dependent oxidoreductase subunit E [Laribacter sp.]
MADDDDLLATLDTLIRANQDRRGALLPLLHAIQAQFGYIPDAAVPRLAQALRQSRAEIDGVISFYRDFRRTPPKAHTLRLCRAESCQAMGADTLAHLLDHALPADGPVACEPVYCLGACACSPALELDGRLHARVTPDRLLELLARLEQQP